MKIKKLLPVLLAVLLLAACGRNEPVDDWEPPTKPTEATQPTPTQPTDPVPKPTEPIQPPTQPVDPTQPEPEPTLPEEEFNPPEEEHTHRFGSWRVGVKATCIKDGYKFRHCDCGEMERKSYKGEHSYGEWYTEIESTCTETGINARNCTVCEEKETEIKPVSPHEEALITPGVPATCTEPGVMDLIECANCHLILQEAGVIEAGHIRTEAERVEPTCKDFGMEGMVTCGRCAEVLQLPQIIDRLGHDLVDGVCTRCGHSCDHGVDHQNPGVIGQFEKVTGEGAVIEGTDWLYRQVTCENCGEESKIVDQKPDSVEDQETEAG